MKIQAITIRPGNVLEYEGKLWLVAKSEIYNPGKGASVVQVEMRDVRAGTKNNVRFRTQEMVEKARLDQFDCTFLYADGDEYHFMNVENFDQMMVRGDIIGDKKQFLLDGMKVQIEFYESEALNLQLPAYGTYEIVEADPVVKGQTASSSYKPAVLDNGARIMVPPHIESGTRVVVKLEDGTYYERAKD
jgi:elongation factor P